MGLRSTSSRYGIGARVFHWLTVVLVLAAYVLSKGDRYSLYSAAADGVRRIHETLGMLVFIVVVLRLLWRLIEPFVHHWGSAEPMSSGAACFRAVVGRQPMLASRRHARRRRCDR